MSVQPDSTLSTFTASDGENIAVQDWPLAGDGAPRAVVLIVHGLGEYAGRYDHVARRLNQWGFAVRSYDQYGHGESGGMRGGLPTATRLLDDLADLAESARRRVSEGVPLLLLGHSMGGLVAASAVARQVLPVDALVLSSPALGTRLSPLQKLLMTAVPRIAPNLAVSNGLDANYLSHDRAVVDAYLADPRVHDRLTGRLARFIVEEGSQVVAAAPRWKVPTLLMYAGEDRLVDPGCSRAFAETAPRDVVESHCFQDLYHEIFNETGVGQEAVFIMLRRWLDARF
jgi:alpha-beta hydrolase superfamily lysophospholipase